MNRRPARGQDATSLEAVDDVPGNGAVGDIVTASGGGDRAAADRRLRHLSASVAISPRPARPQCREAGGPSALRHSPARPAWPPRARLASRGRVPRPGPARLPVRLRQGAHGADLQARLAAGTLGASRSRPVSRPATRTITRLLGARPSPQRPQRRHGRRRQRARGPVLLHAHREEDYAHQQPSLTTQKLRR